MLIAVTGAYGFIGCALYEELFIRGYRVHRLVRTRKPLASASNVHTEDFIVGNIHAQTDWSNALSNIDCVIHCAARAHIMRETESDALEAYRVVNVEGTRNLAEQAVNSGVRRLVFLSSIGVNGIFTDGSCRFAHHDCPKPLENYAISKWEAEQALWDVSARTGLEVVVVRPPLVYGPGAKGNFRRLLRLVASGMPLPLGAVCNRRSLVGLDNLVNLLTRCVDHPAAAGQTFLVSDNHDLSTPDLIRRLARALGKSPRLLPVPPSILRLAGSITGKAAEVERLIGSLQVDITHTREVLGWTPPMSVDEGLRKTAEWYLSQR